MRVVDFRTFGVWVNAGILLAAAVLVWMAGTRLARYADAIGARTGLTRAFLGLILLGVATSLPEIATTITGAAIGNARLVAGNLFGGVALQITLLAIVDIVAVRGALSYFTPQPVLLFQGVMLVLLLALALAGAAAGEPLTIGGLGITPILLVAGFILTIRLSSPGAALPRWRATHQPNDSDSPKVQEPHALEHLSLPRIYVYSALSGLVILAAGWALAQTGDALAEQTRLGPSFVGVALVAASTSLPELSTSLGAVRQGNHQMAVSNILGTNCLEVALFFLADLIYRGQPILAATDHSSMFAGTLGIVVTAIYLIGLLERRDRTILNMGLDSLAVLIVYPLGLVVLYGLR